MGGIAGDLLFCRDLSHAVAVGPFDDLMPKRTTGHLGKSPAADESPDLVFDSSWLTLNYLYLDVYCVSTI